MHYSRVQDTRLRMPIKWHICKEGQAGNKKRQLLVFFELPSLPSAGSRPGCFHNSLGCEPRSLIRVSLGWFDYSKKLRKDNPTPAYSPVSDRRRRLVTRLYFESTMLISITFKKKCFSSEGHHLVDFQSSRVTRLRMPNKWHICKDGQADNKK
jgi:hypothetical protein